MAELQQVLHLYLENSALDSRAVAWAFHDPTDGAGPGIPEPDTTHDPASSHSIVKGTDGLKNYCPYKTGVDALRDGWRLLQLTQLIPRAPGTEHSVSYLSYEFVFERMVAI